MSKNIQPWVDAIAQAKGRFNQISLSNGSQVDYQTEAMFAMQVLQSNDGLMKCHPDSLRNAVINIASIGLSLNPAKKQAYLVPRGGVAVLDISYIGLVQLATDSKGIRYVCADVVRKTDTFIYKGKDERPTHEFNAFDSPSKRGEIIGVYCYARLQGGDYLTEIMSRDDIDKVRNASAAANSPAWKNWYEEMAKKSIIKRAHKLWPKTDPRLQEAIHALNEFEGLADKNGSNEEITMPKRSSAKPPVDAEFEEVPGAKSDSPAEQGGDALATEGQVKVLKGKLKALKVEENALLAAFEIGSINDLPAASINEALDWVTGEAS